MTDPPSLFATIYRGGLVVVLWLAGGGMGGWVADELFGFLAVIASR